VNAIRPRRLTAAFRRCDRAEDLTRQADSLLAERANLSLGDPMRCALSAGAMALHTRAAAWRALAGGDVDDARNLRREACWSAATHRRLIREMGNVFA
jgi:hypothetical protein